MDEETCPRVLTREQMIEKLKAGAVLYVDRKDAPELQDLLELGREGVVLWQVQELEDQYSRIAFWWKERGPYHPR